jgi:hypothetical protein
MLTCQELDAFTEQLCDLTRAMNPMERAKEATALLDLADLPRKFLLQIRAAAVADAHYLDGVPLRQIEPELRRSFQSLSIGLRDHGPTHYASLIKEADGTIRVALITVEGEQTKWKIKQSRAAGRRIVPAAMNLTDPKSPTGLRDGADPAQIWDSGCAQ